MLETMYASEGIGLAATQVDVHEQVIVIDVSDSRDQPLVLINPQITWRSDDMVMAEEGCLSVPAIYDAVQRHARVNVRALGRDGQPLDLQAADLLAVCVQHRDRSPAGQGVRRLPEPAQARPHPHQAAKTLARGAACLMRPSRARRAEAAAHCLRRHARLRPHRASALLDDGYSPVLVLTQPDRPAGRGLRAAGLAGQAAGADARAAAGQPRSLRLDGKFPQDKAPRPSLTAGPRRRVPRPPGFWAGCVAVSGTDPAQIEGPSAGWVLGRFRGHRWRRFGGGTSCAGSSPASGRDVVQVVGRVRPGWRTKWVALDGERGDARGMRESWFLEVDGIVGESVDDRHAGAIEVHSWSWGVSAGPSGGLGSGAGSGKATVAELQLTTHVDRGLAAVAAGLRVRSPHPLGHVERGPGRWRRGAVRLPHLRTDRCAGRQRPPR